MNDFMYNYGWTIIPWLIVLCFWIGVNKEDLGYRQTREERRHTLRLIWLSPFWPIYATYLFIFKAVPWMAKELVNFAPVAGSKIKKGFVDAWLPYKEVKKIDPHDETQFERSEETNFTPRFDIKHPKV